MADRVVVAKDQAVVVQVDILETVDKLHKDKDQIANKQMEVMVVVVVVEVVLGGTPPAVVV